MLHLHQSDTLEALAEAYARHYFQRKPLPGGLFPPQEITLVQNKGMSKWLTTHLACAHPKSIITDVHTQLPAPFLYKLFRCIDPELGDILPGAKDVMQWMLFSLLTNADILSKDPLLQAYLADNDLLSEKKRWMLAQRVADVFDGYQMYRPELLRKWERGADPQDWQAQLWRSIHKNINDRSRASLLESLLHAIRSQPEKLELPSALHLFSVNGLPPQQVKVMVALSTLCDVHWYGIRLADSASSPLISTFGEQGEAFWSVLESSIQTCDAAVTRHEHPRTVSLPGWAQELRGEQAKADDLEHITVSNTHSVLREIEALHDYVLHILETDADIHPGDIMIQCADLEACAPFIHLVFAQPIHRPDKPPVVLPYTITDRGLTNEDATIAAFQYLMRLSKARFKVSELLDFIENPCIRTQWSFSDEHIERIKMWFADMRTHWGIDATHRAGFDRFALESGTIQQALKRLMMGFAMPETDGMLYDNTLPYPHVHTKEEAELAGRLYHLCQLLFDVQASLNDTRSLNDWISFFRHSIVQIVHRTGEPSWAITTLLEPLLRLERISEDFSAYLPERVSGAVMCSFLEGVLDALKTSGGYLSGRITFCSMVPMRNIPAKVIGVLGLNDGTFPRRQEFARFDRMRLEYRKGDRNRRLDDRFLFLELLLSVRKYLYLSFVGQDLRSDEKRAPSVVVQEFLDVVNFSSQDKSERQLVRVHPMQPFDISYFAEDTSALHRSFNANGLLMAKALQANASLKYEKRRHRYFPEPLATLSGDDPLRAIRAEQLAKCLNNPTTYLFEKRLGVRFRSSETQLQDEDLFLLNGLENYAFNQDVLQVLLANEDKQRLINRLKAENRIPLGITAEELLSHKERSLIPIVDWAKKHLSSTASRSYHIPLSEITLSGEWNFMSAEGIMLLQPNVKEKHLLRLWIHHLCYILQYPEQEAKSVYLAETGVYELCHIPHDEALELLNTYADIYLRALAFPIPLFELSSPDYVDKRLKKLAKGDASDTYSSKWNPNTFGQVQADLHNPYVEMLFADVETPEQLTHEQDALLDFAQVSSLVWSPVFKNTLFTKWKDMIA